MQIGPLNVNIHRTVRVAEGRDSADLPPNLGIAKVAKVSDYRTNCPASWEDGAVFVAVHEKEAIWLSFSPSTPCAIVCGAGGVNALTGKPLELKLEDGGYMVAPPQPWIDGWKGEDGSVYQFVATRYQGGSGLSVGEQILGEKSKSGGIGIAVFASKQPLTAVPTFSHHAVSKGLSLGVSEFDSSTRGMRSAPMQEMAVGKGGKIKQKIYPDPYGREVWNTDPVAVSAIYLVSAEDFAVLTGEAIPAPVAQDDYKGPYFEMEDKDAPDLPGTGAFTGLKTVFATSD